MTMRTDAQGRPIALIAYAPDQARDPAGTATGGQFASDSSDQSASQSDDLAKNLYAQLLAMPPGERAAFLAKLPPDQLTRLGKFASTGKEAKGPIADIKNQVGQAMKSRGMDPSTAGLKEKGGAKKKAGAKKSGGSKGGGGKSSGGGSKGGGSKKSGGGSSKKSGESSSKSGGKSSGSKSSGSKSSGSSKAPAKTTTPAKPAPAPAPPEVKPIGLPGRPGARPTPGPPSTQPVRPAGRVGKRRRKPTAR